ncbi:Na+/solute symporter (fragment) [Candidatus Sulfopaludibacter sp. SbA3]
MGITFLILHKNGMEVHTARELIVGIAITTACWVLTAYVGPANDEEVLINFYKKVRPFGPGWERIRLKCGISAAEAAIDSEATNFPRALLGWFSGCIMIWSALFTVGNFLYGRMGYTAALLAIFLVSGTVLLRIVQRLWR